jgi:hypothetical protein
LHSLGDGESAETESNKQEDREKFSHKILMGAPFAHGFEE